MSRKCSFRCHHNHYHTHSHNNTCNVFHAQLRKRDIDLYGSQDLILPPSCLLSVWTESSLNPKTRLSHPVTLSGIDSATTKIYVRRFRDPVVTSSTSGM